MSQTAERVLAMGQTERHSSNTLYKTPNIVVTDDLHSALPVYYDQVNSSSLFVSFLVTSPAPTCLNMSGFSSNESGPLYSRTRVLLGSSTSLLEDAQDGLSEGSDLTPLPPSSSGENSGGSEMPKKLNEVRVAKAT